MQADTYRLTDQNFHKIQLWYIYSPEGDANIVMQFGIHSGTQWTVSSSVWKIKIHVFLKSYVSTRGIWANSI